MLEHEWMRNRNRRTAHAQDEQTGGDSQRGEAEPTSVQQSGPDGVEPENPDDAGQAQTHGEDETPQQPQLAQGQDADTEHVADDHVESDEQRQAEPSAAADADRETEPEQDESREAQQPAADEQVDETAADEPEDDTTEAEQQTDTDEPTDREQMVEEMDVPIKSLRDRLEQVLARQTQLPLDIEARQEVSEKAEDSPREQREKLVRRLLDPTLSLKEAAILLDVCRTTVRRYTNRGMLRCFRTAGNQRRFYLSDILDFMEQRQRSE